MKVNDTDYIAVTIIIHVWDLYCLSLLSYAIASWDRFMAELGRGWQHFGEEWRGYGSMGEEWRGYGNIWDKMSMAINFCKSKLMPDDAPSEVKPIGFTDVV